MWRWRLISCIQPRTVLRLNETIFQPRKLALQALHAPPLVNDHLVESLNHLILIGDPNFKIVDPGPKGLQCCHRCVHHITCPSLHAFCPALPIIAMPQHVHQQQACHLQLNDGGIDNEGLRMETIRARLIDTYRQPLVSPCHKPQHKKSSVISTVQLLHLQPRGYLQACRWSAWCSWRTF